MSSYAPVPKTASTTTAYELRTVQPQESLGPDDAASTHTSSSSSSVTIAPEPTPLSRPLKRNLRPLSLFFIYAALAISAWTLTCLLSQKRIAMQKFEHPSYKKKYSYTTYSRVVRLAAILRATTNAVTIVVTTSICSMASVVYMQSRPLRLRQTMALADKACFNLRALFRYGSPLLWATFCITSIGLVGQIIQEGLITPTPTLAPTNGGSIYSQSSLMVNQVPGLFVDRDLDYSNVARLRGLLVSAKSSDYSSNRWLDMDLPPRSEESEASSTRSSDYFYAQPPPDFSIGVRPGPDYAPRINSSAKYEEISEEAFRAECRSDSPGGFFTDYILDHRRSSIGIMACMAGDLTKSPWRPTRDRQDITEELYLNITRLQSYNKPLLSKVTMRSALGYFELPGLHNNNTAGPLLAKDPYQGQILKGGRLPNEHRAEEDYHDAKIGNSSLISVQNKGPLLTVALALFAEGSYIADRFMNPAAFDSPPFDYKSGISPSRYNACLAVGPFQFMFGSSSTCQGPKNSGEDSAYSQITNWAAHFIQAPRSSSRKDNLVSNFNQAAFWSNMLWLGNPDYTSYNPPEGLGSSYRYVTHDKGVSIIIPRLSPAGLIIGSVLLGVHLAGLLALALYAAWTPTWTRSLDAFAMMRIGAQFSTVLAPMKLESFPSLNMKWLEYMPGSVGDATPEKPVGTLAMGAHPLDPHKRYVRHGKEDGNRWGL